jgi:hypothetical protein
VFAGRAFVGLTSVKEVIAATSFTEKELAEAGLVPPEFVDLEDPHKVSPVDPLFLLPSRRDRGFSRPLILLL